MNCNSITSSLSIRSTTASGARAVFDNSTILCHLATNDASSIWEGSLAGIYDYSIELTNLHHGIHEIIVNNVTNHAGTASTNVSVLTTTARTITHPK